MGHQIINRQHRYIDLQLTALQVDITPSSTCFCCCSREAMKDILIRHAEPSDYQPVISEIDHWWGGRKMVDMLPKLFFVHFRNTSFVAEHGAKIVGFVVGFVSQTTPGDAYIHFVGIDPGFRGQGLARGLYERHFEAVRRLGCRRIHCITSPINKGSIAFHLRMGFSIEPGEKIIDGIAVVANYDGQGEDRVLFIKELPA
jgi:ribosomal protein S18 acetylase RimI-like enzyme